jgi:hypothetical protein
MTFQPTGGGGLAGLTVGAGRKLGGMVSKHVDGANMVHAIAIQGLFNAHAQQQEHEHHLASIREAAKMSPKGGFTVRTGTHSMTVGKIKGGKGGGHDEGGNRTPPPEDHVEAAHEAAESTPAKPTLPALGGTTSAPAPDLKAQIAEGAARGRSAAAATKQASDLNDSLIKSRGKGK